jgi:hypothetical protein
LSGILNLAFTAAKSNRSIHQKKEGIVHDALFCRKTGRCSPQLLEPFAYVVDSVPDGLLSPNASRGLHPVFVEVSSEEALATKHHAAARDFASTVADLNPS